MTRLIEVTNLSHFFGEKKVLENLSFSVERGSVVGLLGPSGAGKTTLINLLTGQLAPTAGSIQTPCGRLITGIMMDSFGLYERLSVWDNLELFADICHVSHKKIDTLLEKTELSAARRTPVCRLSKGMRSRVNFCRALLKDVDVLFLDEPTAGLDPATTEKIHDLIREAQAGGTTVFLSTHNMHEAQQLCGHIFLLNEGKFIESGNPHEICLKYNLANTIRVVQKNGEIHTLDNTGRSAKLLARMMEEESVLSIHSSEPDLEHVFLHLTGRRLNE